MTSPVQRLVLMIALGLLAIAPSTAEAQQRRYRPATSTVSPYLNLLRNNDGDGLPNYYSLVRPQLQQQSFNSQQQQFNRTQSALADQQMAAIGSLAQQLQPGITPTGKGAGFMTSGRYFQNFGSAYGGRPNRRR